MVIGLAAVFVALSLGIGYSQDPGLAPGKIEPDVLNTLQSQGKVTAFAILTEQADTSFAAKEQDWDRRGQLVVETLQAVANRTQPAVLAQIASANATPAEAAYWVINAIKFTTSSAEFLKELAARPDIASIIVERHFPVPPTEPGAELPGIQAVEWGVMRVKAPEVWQQFNVRGEGIIVANIDTGVAFTHSALVMQYRGRNPDGTFNHNYNWVDPSRICGNPSLAPCDNNGHGTHTMGTMVGDDGDPGTNQIGVAPKAKWIAAKGCESGGCSTGALLASGQWVLAPTDLNGQNPRPDLRPHIVNNSWGGGPSDPFYRMTVQNWRNAGLFPAFASGNPGAACGAAGIPSVYPESFGIGATDINDNIAGFSGRGPATFFGGILKPQVSAPGVNVRSSVPPNGYANFSGTSMATPHTAGAVALIWSARPSLIGNIDGTATALQSTARPRLDAQCGPAGPPNNVYGWGIIDVFAAIQSITPIRVNPTRAEVCRPASATSTVTVFGGPGLYQGDVTLSLDSVSPPTDTITATFSLNPVPRPPIGGSSSTMTVATTAGTPAGTYTLTVKGTDGTVTATAEFTLTVVVEAPAAPALLTPADGATDVNDRPTFTWSAAAGARNYRLQIFLGEGCSGTPVRDFDNLTGTSFRIPEGQGLDTSQTYSWKVTAKNACGETASTCFSFRTTSCVERWAVKPPVPVMNGPSQSSVVAAAGRLYVIGGGIGPGPTSRINQVWEFDPAGETWARKADVPPPGAGSTFGSAAELNGKIYVFGGFTTAILNTTWIYDVAANSWSRGSDLPVANFGIAVAAIGGKIYLAYGSGFGRQTWEYDPAADTYTRKADPPAIPALFRVHGKAIGDEMHAFAGGFNGTAHVVYNAATNTWRTAPPIPFGVTDPAVSVMVGRYHVVGGRPAARTQIFDPQDNTWTQGPPVPGFPGGLDNTAGDAIARTMHVVGGFDGANSVNVHRAFQACGPPDFALTVTPPLFNEVCAGQSIDFQVGVEPLGSFTSPVMLSGANLPPGTSVSFAENPIRPGETTTMTLSTSRPITRGRYSFDVVGQAVTPPPAEPRSVRTSTFIETNNPPEAPEQISPPDGETNASLRPTLIWNEPFVPDVIQPTAPTGDAATVSNSPPGVGQIEPEAFGASIYHVQVALDPDFTQIVFEADTRATSITLPRDLSPVTIYYWRVNAANACGTGPDSAVRSFITGSCLDGFSIVAPYLQPGILWNAATTFGGRIYSFGGSNTIVGGIPAIANSYVYDPGANAWSSIAPLPAPRLLFNAAEVGGKIYVAGGGTSSSFDTGTNTLFEYTVAANTWATKRPMALRRVGAAMAAAGGKVYIFGGFVEGAATPSNNVVEYDPAADTYTPKANMPTARGRTHAAVIGGKIHVIGGQGGTQRENEVFDPATNTWQSKAPTLWLVGFDMGTTALFGKIYVFGRDGSLQTSTQFYDPATDTWTPFVPMLRAANNNQAVSLGSSIYVIGGFDGAASAIHNLVQRFRSCDNSSHFIPFVVDGDGTAPGVSNERTALILSNAISGSTASASVLFYANNGILDSRKTFSLSPNEVKTVSDIIRDVRGTSGVQNAKGSLALFGTEPFHAMASISNNNDDTNDPARVESQPLIGTRNGFVPLIQSGNLHSHTAFTNSSSRTANVQLLAYPPEGGDTPVGSASVTVPPRGLVDFADIVSRLGLPSGHWGQLSWNSTQPISVFARDITGNESHSGSRAVHAIGDGSRTNILAYVEDTETYSSDLQINNTGPFTANVTVRLIDVDDPTGGTPGSSSSRDIPVRVNSATYLTDVIRWALRDDSGVISGKRGFLVVTSPQLVTVEATLLNRETGDPAISDAASPISSAFTPTIIRFEPFGPRIPALSSRVAIGNPGGAVANVLLTPFHPNGAPARPTPFAIRVTPGGQYFTEDIAAAMGLPPAVLGWMAITSDTPVVVYNHRRSDGTGEIVPIHPR